MTLVDISKTKETSKTAEEYYLVIVGTMCLIVGQLFHASQAIVEERIVKGFREGQEPWYMMGCEGVIGLCITSTLLIIA